MSVEDRRQTDLDTLHPVFRAKVEAVITEIKNAKLTFEVFEARRSPQRQRYLYAKGRTAAGSKVTNAKAWESYHQYGLAVDFVLKTNGNWDWSTAGANGQAWKELHKIAAKHGLEPLSWELPHLQLAGLKIKDLMAGHYPANGDQAWADALEAAIAGWDGFPTAPPPPTDFARPGLADLDNVPDAVVEDEEQPARFGLAAESTSSEAIFELVQPFIEKWEGGFVDHPSDPGGATNMGITLATLSRWRNRTVTKQDVKALTRDEARQIMKALYFDKVSAGEMPPRLAAAVYNAAVLHGPSRSARFLQTALGGQNIAVEIDGSIGEETLRGVARADVPRLVADFLGEEERFLRSLAIFATFGRGWMNRLNSLREFSASLPPSVPVASMQNGGIVVPDPTKPAPDLAAVIAQVEQLIRMLSGVAAPTPAGSARPPAAPDALSSANIGERLAGIIAVIRQLEGLGGIAGGPGGVVLPPIGKDARPLTPVNAALGQGIGKMLDGKKSAIGIIGSLITVLAGSGLKDAGIPAGTTGLLPIIAGAVPYLQPIMLALTAWGVLGKFDKWIKLPPAKS